LRGEAFRRYFEIPSRPVAVKLLKDELEPTEGSFRYCEAVRLASHGERIVLSRKNLSCGSAEIALGLIEPLFDDDDNFIKNIKSVVVEPYEGQNCDVVLIIATPEKIMRIGSTYYQIFKKELSAKFSGETAVCGEATRDVLKSESPNITFLCEGAREYGNYRNDEIVLGFPEETFKKMDDAISKEQIRALCGCLMDDLPKRVIEKFEELGFEKATDHFIGMYNGKIVNIYVMRGDRISNIGVFTSVKFRSDDEAKKVVEQYSGNSFIYQRENWVDIYRIVEFEDLEEIVGEKKFEKELIRNIEAIIQEARKIKEIA